MEKTDGNLAGNSCNILNISEEKLSTEKTECNIIYARNEIGDIVGNLSNRTSNALEENISTESNKTCRESETIRVLEEKLETFNRGKSLESSSTQGLSKRQQKKLLKKIQYLKNKPLMRKIEKAKKKKRRLEIVEQNRAAGIIQPPRKKRKLMKESCNKVQVAIDLSLDHLMTEAEIGKTVKQIQRCYSENRNAENPLQLYLTSFCNKLKDILVSRQGCLNWDINHEAKNYYEVFGKSNVVYLTSDSPNALATLSEQKCYVIGGLVDHNRHKGLCFKLAEEAGVEHARFPIDEFLEMKSRKVLTINHVFSILLGVSNGNSWEESLLRTLPSRKGATPKNGETNFDEVEAGVELKCVKPDNDLQTQASN